MITLGELILLTQIKRIALYWYLCAFLEHALDKWQLISHVW